LADSFTLVRRVKLVPVASFQPLPLINEIEE
jgi:hypothetical protein